MRTLLSIRTFGDPVLREEAVPVKCVTAALRTLANDMLATMHAAQGVGLAAQQVGRTEAICVIDLPEEYDREEEDGPRLNPAVPLPLVLLNPERTGESDAMETMDEGCLSFPDIRGSVARHRSIHIRYLGLDGKTHELDVHGFLARAVQHEMDHLAGNLFIDRFSHVKKLAVRGKLKRLQAETREHLTGDNA